MRSRVLTRGGLVAAVLVAIFSLVMSSAQASVGFNVVNDYASASGTVSYNAANPAAFVWSGSVCDENSDGQSAAVMFYVTYNNGTHGTTKYWTDTNGNHSCQPYSATPVALHANINFMQAEVCRIDLSAGGSLNHCKISDGHLNNPY